MAKKDLRKKIVENEAAKGCSKPEVDAVLSMHGLDPIDPAKTYTDAKLLRIVEHREKEPTRLEKTTEKIYEKTAEIAVAHGISNTTDRAVLIAFLKENSYLLYDFLESYSAAPRRLKIIALDLAKGCTAMEAKRDLEDIEPDGALYRSVEDISLLYAFEQNAFVGIPGGPQHYSTPQEVAALAQKIRALVQEARADSGTASENITPVYLQNVLAEAEDENRKTKLYTKAFFRRVFPGFEENQVPKAYRTEEQFLGAVRQSADYIALTHERTRRELIKQLIKLIYADLIFGPYNLLFNKIEYDSVKQKEKYVGINKLPISDLHNALRYKIKLPELARELFKFLNTDSDLRCYLNTNTIFKINHYTVANVLRDCLDGSGDITRTFFICLISFIQVKLTECFKRTMSSSQNHADKFQRMLALLPQIERQKLLRANFDEDEIENKMSDADIYALAALSTLPTSITSTAVKNSLKTIKVSAKYDFFGFFAFIAQLTLIGETDCVKWILDRMGLSFSESQTSWLNTFITFICYHSDDSELVCEYLTAHKKIFNEIEKVLHDCKHLNLAEFSSTQKSPFELLLRSFPGWEGIVQAAFESFFDGSKFNPIRGRILSNEHEVNDILLKCGWNKLHPERTEWEFSFDRVAHVVFCKEYIEEQIRNGQIPDYKQTVWCSYLGEPYTTVGTNLKYL